MKLSDFTLVLVTLLGWISWSHAAQVDFSTLSPCTLSCLLNTFAAANCSITDTTCQCENEGLVDATSACMLNECTLSDSLALGRLRQQVCELPSESRSRELLIVSLTLFALSIVAVSLRLLSRLLVSKRVYGDDVVIVIATVLLVPFSGLGFWMTSHGLGRHTWDVSEPTVTKIFQLYWVDETFYIIVLLLTKVSLLLFYLRVFPSPRFQIWGKVVLGLVILPGLVILLMQLLQCLPVQYNWDKSLENAKCLNINALTYAHAGINIAQDFLILAMPIPELMPLKLDLQQKIGLFVMFQVGIFACVTSIVRLRFLTQFGGTNSNDPLWKNSAATIWTAAETNTAIICSCLPAIRALYKTGRSIASEAASKRKSTTLLSSMGRNSRPFQLQSLESGQSREEPVPKNGKILVTTEIGAWPESESPRQVGRAF